MPETWIDDSHRTAGIASYVAVDGDGVLQLLSHDYVGLRSPLE